MRNVGRWFFIIVATLLVIGGISSLAGGLVSHAIAPPDEPTGGAVTAILAGAAMLVVGWAMGMASFPTFTACSGVCVAALALLSGIGIAVMAGALSRVQPDTFDGDRGTHDAWLGAAACFLLALALSLNFAAWLRRSGSRPAIHHIQYVIAIGYGSILFVSGLVGAVRVIVGIIQGGSMSGDVGSTLSLAGSTVLALGPGAILLWHGAGGLTGVGSGRFRTPPVWVPLAAAALAIALGAVLIQSDNAIWFLPIIHMVAIVAPGLAILAFVSTEARRAGRVVRSTWRELSLMVAYGAAVAATIAAIINTFAIVASFVVYLTVRGAFDGMGRPGDFGDTLRGVDSTMGQTGVLVVLLIVIAVIGPLNEELWKGYGVRLLKRDRPTRYQAFLWGLAAGVGFGMVEANEYSLSAFARSPYRWWDTMLLRGGTSSLHALASGTVGIAWYYAFSGRRSRFFALFFTAVGLHGSWNALNVLTAARVLPWFRTASNHDLEIVLEVAIGVLTIPILLILRLLSRSLAREDEPPAAPLPPARELPAVVPTGFSQAGGTLESLPGAGSPLLGPRT